MTVVEHPATYERLNTCVTRLLEMRKKIEEVAHLALAGMLVEHFTADELKLMDRFGYFSNTEQHYILKAHRNLLEK